MDNSHAGPISFIRSLNLRDAIVMVVSAMIGSGIFIVSAQTAFDLHQPWLLVLAWLLAGLMTLLGALAYGELSACWPDAGGQYVYLKKIWGEPVAFLFGWTFFSVMQTGSVAAVAIAFGRFLGILFPVISSSYILFQIGHFIFTTQSLAAIGLIMLLTFLNCRGIRGVARLQSGVTLITVLAMCAMIVSGLHLALQRHVLGIIFNSHYMIHSFAGSHSNTPLIWILGATLVGPLFAFDGWNNLSFLGSELKNPQKNLPWAFLWGVGSVTVLYGLINWIYIAVLPFQQIISARNGILGADLLKVLLGGFGEKVLAGIILIAIIGCMNSMMVGGARSLYAMARDGRFFRQFATLGEKSRTPERALLLQCVWSIALSLSGSYGQLLDYILFIIILFYLLTVGGLIWARIKYPDIERPSKVPGYPYLPLIYCALAIWIEISLLICQPLFSFIGIILVLTGIPLYYKFRKQTEKNPLPLCMVES